MTTKKTYQEMIADLHWENYLLRSRLDAAVELLADDVELEVPDPDPDDWRFWEVVINELSDRAPHDGRDHEVRVPGVMVEHIDYRMTTSSSSIEIQATHTASPHEYNVAGILTVTGVKVVYFSIAPPDGDYLGE